MSKRVIVEAAQEAVDYMWTAVDALKEEIGGIGYIQRREDGSLYWWKTLLVPQTVSPHGIDYTDPSYMITKAHEDGVLGNEDFIWLWWHSHCNMGVFWSSTDTDEFIAPFRDAGAPSLVSIVGNHKHEYKMRLDVFDNPLAPHLTLENVTYDTEASRELEDRVWEDIDEFVVLKKDKPKHAAKATSSQHQHVNEPPPSSSSWDLDDDDLDSLGRHFGMDLPLSQSERAELYAAFGPTETPNPYGTPPSDPDYETHITFTNPAGDAERVPLKDVIDRRQAPLSPEAAETAAVMQ